MSVISEEVRKGLFSKSSDPALIGEGKLVGVYDTQALAKTPKPYGIFSRIAPGDKDYAFGSPAPTLVRENDLWLLKVLADANSSATKEPQEFAEDMLAIWLSVLGNTLTLSTRTVLWMEPFADMPPIDEPFGDDYIYQRGVLLRIQAR